MSLIKVGICGAPSAGKTTSAERIRAVLKRQYGLPSVEAVREYARHYIEETGKVKNIHEQWSILQGQERWERQAERTYDFVISDSPMFLPYIYTVTLADLKDPKHRHLLLSMYEEALLAVCEYEVIYLLPLPEKVQQDGLRVQNEDDARKLHNAMDNFLEGHLAADKFERVPPLMDEIDEGTSLRAEWIVKNLESRGLLK